MLIQQTRILNVEKHLEALPKGADLRLAVTLTEDNRQKLPKIGFADTPSDGETILPALVGPASRFNAEGKWVIHKDQPKESRYIRTVRWQWKQWSGRDSYEEHEDFRDIWRDCYPREHMPPSAIELTYVAREGWEQVISPVFRNRPEEHEAIGHGINLMLELFGMCELVRTDLQPFSGLRVRKVNWRMLPPGEYPWKRLRDHLDGMLKRQSENTRSVILDRQETMKGHGPDTIYVGVGGFSDYLAYVFKSRDMVVLESVKRDNAIYVFGRDWERVSQLTKGEVLSGQHHKARIIHAKGWKDRLDDLLKDTRAA